MKNRIFILIASLLGASPLYAAATPNELRKGALDSICPGEKHELEVTYLGVPGLNVELEVLPPEMLGPNRVFRARGVARNSALVGLFFKLNDTVDTWIDMETFHSRRFKLVQDESRIQRTSIESFYPEKSETVFENRYQKKNESPQEFKGTFPTPRLVQDTFSAIYFLRALALTVGADFTIPVVSEGRMIQVSAKVIGMGTVKNRGDRQDAFIVRLVKLNNEDAKGQPAVENIVYISADTRRVLLEFSVYSRFGHITASLKRFTEGTCTPAK